MFLGDEDAQLPSILLRKLGGFHGSSPEDHGFSMVFLSLAVAHVWKIPPGHLCPLVKIDGFKG